MQQHVSNMPVPLFVSPVDLPRYDMRPEAVCGMECSKMDDPLRSSIGKTPVSRRRKTLLFANAGRFDDNSSPVVL